MNFRCMILAVGVFFAAVGASRALDIVKTTGDRVAPRGQITAMSPTEIELKIGQLTKKIPVNEVVSISYDGEPASLSTARMALQAGRYEDALTSLEKVVASDQNRMQIKQDIEFYRALCKARLALGGSGEIVAAGKDMSVFVSTHKGSYHWLRANEVVGDLYLALGKYDKAEEFYATVGKAPWPDFKMRSGVAVGRAQLAQKKTAEALRSFEGVLASNAAGELAESQRLAATVGKARCQAVNKQYDQAIQAVNAVIAKSDPEEMELNAQAYNTLGTALRASGREKEARLAFLHVDLLYFTIPEAHAEALANLAELWEKARKTDRAARARRLLEQRYKNSPWAQ